MGGIVIAGTHSGCGKTTVTLGILAALTKKGLAVQPFKAGPDFIDAGLHRLAAARPSRNLDRWMCGQDYVIGCYQRHGKNADIAVIEGVMGMYDGDFSTAHLAGLLQVPVLLVVDAYGMAESAGAIVKGYHEFKVQGSEFEVTFAGIIFNRVASENHYRRLKDSVKDIPVLGYLPRELNFEIPHRHLGLTTAEENPIPRENIEKLADAVLRYIDVDAIVRIAGPAQGNVSRPEGAGGAKRAGKCKLAAAYDKAFCFYYEDNFDLLRDAGAEIVFFSPLSDQAVPAGADAVYIGGGYPEMHARALARNASLLRSVRAWVDAGRPLYAECGGLMYLSKGLHDCEGTFFPMAGVFPFETRMTKRPRLGYREAVFEEDCILGARGGTCRGHEFHYSEIMHDAVHAGMGNTKADTSADARVEVSEIYSMRDHRGSHCGTEGYRYRNALASYIHVHFGSNGTIAERFIGFIQGERIT